MSGNQLVPIGKYKGQPVEVLQQDKGYCEWLKNQDWFRQRFPELRTLIVNNFGQDSETPEHNLLQAKFLDSGFCLRLARSCGVKVDDWPGRIISYVTQQRRAIAELIGSGRVGFSFGRNNGLSSPEFIISDDGAMLAEVIETGERWGGERESIKWKFRVSPGDVEVSSKFEVQGWDAVIRILTSSSTHVYRDGEVSSDCRGVTKEWLSDDVSIYIEAKPSLGDDYPAVLRQIKSRKTDHWGDHKILLVENITSVVPRQQIADLFWRDRIRLLELSGLSPDDSIPMVDVKLLLSEWMGDVSL